jgi:hypothetical protein
MLPFWQLRESLLTSGPGKLSQDFQVCLSSLSVAITKYLRLVVYKEKRPILAYGSGSWHVQECSCRGAAPLHLGLDLLPSVMGTETGGSPRVCSRTEKRQPIPTRKG